MKSENLELDPESLGNLRVSWPKKNEIMILRKYDANFDSL